MDLQRCQSSIFKIEINNFERYDLIVNITTKSSQYLPYYIHYRRFPNRMIKVYTPPPPTSINPWLARNNECLQLTTTLGEFCLIILIWFEHGTGHPGDQPFSREWGAESTPVENKRPSMADIDSPNWNMSCSSIQNIISFEGLEFGTYKFTWNGR